MRSDLVGGGVCLGGDLSEVRFRLGQIRFVTVDFRIFYAGTLSNRRIALTFGSLCHRFDARRYVVALCIYFGMGGGQRRLFRRA